MANPCGEVARKTNGGGSLTAADSDVKDAPSRDAVCLRGYPRRNKPRAVASVISMMCPGTPHRGHCGG